LNLDAQVHGQRSAPVIGQADQAAGSAAPRDVDLDLCAEHAERIALGAGVDVGRALVLRLTVGVVTADTRSGVDRAAEAFVAAAANLERLAEARDERLTSVVDDARLVTLPAAASEARAGRFCEAQAATIGDARSTAIDVVTIGAALLDGCGHERAEDAAALRAADVVAGHRDLIGAAAIDLVAEHAVGEHRERSSLLRELRRALDRASTDGERTQDKRSQPPLRTRSGPADNSIGPATTHAGTILDDMK
jgi:hypothetical protein